MPGLPWWGLNLSRPIAVRDLSAPLRTLRDAGAYIANRLATVTVPAPRDHAAGLLIAAAESGDPDDIAAATEQVARALSAYGMLPE